MASNEYMVPGTTRQKITLSLFGAIVVIVIGLLWWSGTHARPNGPEYVVSGDDINIAILDGIQKADQDPRSVARTKAVIVPHHLVATKSIALGIKNIASSSPKIVVIISPDHFAHCPTLLCTTNGTYKTFFGDVGIDDASVSELEKSDLVSSSELFHEEHGVYTIVPYIKTYLPQAKIVPIVISQSSRGSEEKRAQVLALLQPLLTRGDVSLVVSSDFSHYLPLAETLDKDSKTQKSLCEARSDEILHLENPSQSDCPLCLWLLEQEALKLGFWNPVLLAHTNSAELLHDTSARRITSHFAFAFTSETVPAGSCYASKTAVTPAHILFVGDMSFDRYIRQTVTRHSSDYVFSCIDPLLTSADLVVGNLEGPITTHESVSAGTIIGSPANYRFTFPTTTASMLFQHNIKLVSIGNNHIGDFGIAGLQSTQSFLTKAGVAFFGGLSGNTSIYRTTLGGTDLSFINYNQFGGQTALETSTLITQEHAEGRTVLVYAHWGEEYTAVTDQVRSTARLFAEAGADLIIGSHPHVVQEHEHIGNTLVYYSLGNFIFDQYFQTDVTKGLSLLVTISGKTLSVEEKPVNLTTSGRTCPD